MTTAQLVDRGLEIRAQLKTLNEELEGLEAKLQTIARAGEQVDLKDADREGKQFLAKGSKVIVPVIFTADKIVGSFGRDSAVHRKILLAANGKLESFFAPVNAFKNRFENGKKFRALASDTLGAAAPPFVTACLARDKYGVPKSDTKIEWDSAEEL